MKRSSHSPRFVKYGVLAITSILLLAVAVIHVQQHLLRYRAEKLLSDIQSLELRKATFSEAQVVFERWRTWGRYEGECNEVHCAMEITLGDFGFHDLRDLYTHVRLMRTVMIVGGRPGNVTASISVENGIVWSKSFGVIVEVPPNITKGEPGDDGDWVPDGEYPLLAIARSISRFDEFDQRSWLHPNYTIWRPGGCNKCVAGYALFTPYAAPEDVNRLMQFNLSCLTRWNPCTTHRDIMPVAWAEHLKEEPQENAARDNHTCGTREVELLGRDAENIAIMDVVANREETRGDERVQVLTVRLAERLKDAVFWSIGESHDLTVEDRNLALGEGNRAAQLRPGTQFIMLFTHEKGWDQGPQKPSISLDECGAVPLTKDNLALVKRGIEQDYESSLPIRDGTQ